MGNIFPIPHSGEYFSNSPQQTNFVISYFKLLFFTLLIIKVLPALQECKSPSAEGQGSEKFPIRHQWQHFIPHLWFSSCGKKNPTTRGFATRGRIFFTTPAKPCVGNKMLPLVTHGKFYFSPFVASPLMGKNPNPNPPQKGIRPLKSLFKHLIIFVQVEHCMKINKPVGT